MFHAKYYVAVGDPDSIPRIRQKIDLVTAKTSQVLAVKAEYCYYVRTPRTLLSESDEHRIKWIFSHPPRDLASVKTTSSLCESDENSVLFEVGPR
jgi:hypothetical protein